MGGRRCRLSLLYLSRARTSRHAAAGDTRRHHDHCNPVFHFLPFMRAGHARACQTLIDDTVLQDQVDSSKPNSPEQQFSAPR